MDQASLSLCNLGLKIGPADSLICYNNKKNNSNGSIPFSFSCIRINHTHVVSGPLFSEVLLEIMYITLTQKEKLDRSVELVRTLNI